MSQLIQITDKAGQKIEDKPLDLAEVQAKLSSTKGKTYWRNLEELSEQPGFTEMLRREFPGQAPKDWAPLSRRDFVKLMGASLALAGLSGCAFQPQEKIVPYVKAPDEEVPGIPMYYASAMPFLGYAHGILAESNQGRPTKIEGNPDHPTTRGRTDIWMQASILDLYDPDRSQIVRKSGASNNWETFAGELSAQVERARATRGRGFALLTETMTSPTQLALVSEVQAQLPEMTWVSYDPINRDNVLEGARLAFGRDDIHPVYHFNRANVVVSLDCDFLLEEPGHIAYGREFISRRRVTEGQKTMNRLYVAESSATITGAMADHRFPTKASSIDSLARALAQAVGVPGVTGQTTEENAKWISEIAKDLVANRGNVLVVAGSHQPPAVHAIAFAINSFLGSVGPQSATSFHLPVVGNRAPNEASLRTLVDEMNGERVQTVLIMGGNAAYNTPADLKFGEALQKVPFRAHIGPYENETSVLCTWHLPEAHYLETWSDARALDGTVSLVQPLIRPLYEAAKSPIEVLSALLGNDSASGYEAVRANWLRTRGGVDNLQFQKFWQKVVHDGLVPGTASPAVGVGAARLANLPTVTPEVGGLEINFRPDPTIWDGRFANNAWLQECPKPYSKITWDNAVFVSPNTAHKNKWTTNQEVEVKLNGRSIKGGVFLLPGQPDETITLHLGYGRTQVGKIGSGSGFDANQLRTVDDMWFASGAQIVPTGEVYKIATTSNHNIISQGGKDTTFGESLRSDDAKTKLIDNILTPESADTDIDGTHGRDIVRVGTFDEYLKGHLPTSERDKKGVPLAYPENPAKFREALGLTSGDGHETGHNKGHGADGQAKDNHGKEASGHTGEDSAGHERPMAKDRELEGFPSFYPRNSDPLALTPYANQEANEDLARTSKALGRDNMTQQWGMTIDLQSCIGCNSCVIACQSENNSAVVGKDQVLMGREMHWMRIDAYYRGSYENPEVYFEPMLCQHCEKAPCAPVCPFNAVMNSPEGINEQIYNRCVGTKYCENNCPYKVRRFNFLQYSDQQTPVIQLMQNPNVIQRSRGVMEKCNYCAQRVKFAQWQAGKEDRYVADGEIVVACQQSCPTDAIVFGDINDPESKVSKLKRGPLTFGILTEFNTMPRTSYLARIKNPNPALVALGEEFETAILGGEKASEGHGEEAETKTGRAGEGGNQAKPKDAH